LSEYRYATVLTTRDARRPDSQRDAEMVRAGQSILQIVFGPKAVSRRRQMTTGPALGSLRTVSEFPHVPKRLHSERQLSDS